ncbi:hypothetical protein L1987_59441 [Smallanthus sonchifolius]|uniref:Uncharacterized protein n=1 Tax=Smallanthus sonchifolius TaxID=185202 RepID=A0ACB9D5A3_9ASTR|nr:hypothetical protein L1987_59441 [Smallanthus sonchifolius]
MVTSNMQAYETNLWLMQARYGQSQICQMIRVPKRWEILQSLKKNVMPLKWQKQRAWKQFLMVFDFCYCLLRFGGSIALPYFCYLVCN